MLLIPDPSDEDKDERGRSSLRATVAIRGIDSGQLLRLLSGLTVVATRAP